MFTHVIYLLIIRIISDEFSEVLLAQNFAFIAQVKIITDYVSNRSLADLT
jgi:hypothetical protein